MAKTMLICGYGTGISRAVAAKFGAEGFQLALVARNSARLADAVKELEAKGVRAAAFPVDLSEIEGADALVKSVHDKLGSVDVVLWNAYASGAGDLLAANPAEVRVPFDMAVTSLVAIVKAAASDLKASRGALLVTNGGLGLLDSQADAVGVQWGTMGLAVANAAKHKLVRLLDAKLKPDGIYVGELTVLTSVKGTQWDSGSATLEASSIAARFWDMYRDRKQLSTQIG